MDWFRWWHGTLTDPKFQWVARKSGQPFTAVIALWVALLERASGVTQGDAYVTRGDVTGFDCDDHDVLFGLDDGSCSKIFEAFIAKGMIADSRIAKWEERQPKREDSSAERTRAYRDRKAKESSVTNGDVYVTQSDEERRDETPRGEEIREEDESSTDVDDVTGKAGSRMRSPLPDCPHKKLIDMYARHLPELPYPATWEGEDQKSMRMRWRWVMTAEKRDGTRHATDEKSALAWFERFFGYVAKSDFLTGRNGVFTNCDLGWLVKAKNFSKVVSGNYENKEPK
jgi:hypothetical protein